MFVCPAVALSTGTASTLTLPATGAVGSLGANKDIVIDTAAPTITITTPVDGATYLLSQKVAASFGCTDRAGSGVAACFGPVANGSAIDTSTAASHAFRVDASDKAANTSSKTLHC